jgi:hypothetical protein
MTIENFVEYLDGGALEPLHEGTIRYLKEKGLWKAEHQLRQDKNLELANKYIEAYQAALGTAEEKGVIVDPGNKAWTDLWKEIKEARGISKSYGLQER